MKSPEEGIDNDISDIFASENFRGNFKDFSSKSVARSNLS